MEKTTLSLLIIVGLSIIGVIGDFFIKLAGSGKEYINLKWFIVGFIVYMSTVFGWFYVMKHIKLSTLGAFYAVSTVLFLTLVGVFYFREHLNMYEITGILLAVASITLLGRFA